MVKESEYMESINIECQVFTPHNIVVEILNQVGYIEKLYGKKDS